LSPEGERRKATSWKNAVRLRSRLGASAEEDMVRKSRGEKIAILVPVRRSLTLSGFGGQECRRDLHRAGAYGESLVKEWGTGRTLRERRNRGPQN